LVNRQQAKSQELKMSDTPFYELGHSWPEGYASVHIKLLPQVRASHLSVYKGPCDENYVKKFHIIGYKDGFIPDALPNNLGWLVVSPFCRQAIASSRHGGGVAFVSLASIVTSASPSYLADFSLISPVQVLDCLDTKSPDISWSDSAHTFVESYLRLSLLSRHIPDEASFFGVQQLPCTDRYAL
jgi:hypothetical protein